MKIQFKEVAKHYIGCDVIDEENNRGTFWGYKTSMADHALVDCKKQVPYVVSIEKIKPVLRPLNDMTEEEQRQSYVLAGWEPEYSYEMLDEPDRKEETNLISLIGRPNVWNYLLSKHFDLFGLIESGEAVDKTKVGQ